MKQPRQTNILFSMLGIMYRPKLRLKTKHHKPVKSGGLS